MFDQLGLSMASLSIDHAGFHAFPVADPLQNLQFFSSANEDHDCQYAYDYFNISISEKLFLKKY